MAILIEGRPKAALEFHKLLVRMRIVVLGLVFCGLLLTMQSPPFAWAGENQVASPLGQASRFGIDYVFPLDDRFQNKPLARQLAQTGAGWVNFGLVGWNQIEPRPPRGGRHKYRWSKLDRAVRHWQQAGFDLVITLRMGKGWFAGPQKFAPKSAPFVMKIAMRNSDRLPKPERYGDFSAWVFAMVERYDGDSKADMPGLARPVLHYQVCNEVGNPIFWTGTPSDYFQLLAMARKAARRANPKVKIIPSGLRPNDFFTTNPQGEDPERHIQAYLKRLAPAYRQGILRMLDFDERIARAAGQYEILDAAGNGSWHQGTQGFFRWLKRVMTEAGNKAQVWDLESRTEPILKAVPTTHAHLDAEIPGGPKILKMLRRKLHPRHKEATRWYRAEQARLLAKVYATRFAGGAQKVFVGMPMDWDQGLERHAWNNPYMGLLSSDAQPWPAMYALKFLVSELDGFKAAKRIKAPGDMRLYLFTFDSGRKPVWMAWLHESRPRGLDDPLPRRQVPLPQVASAAKAWEIPTTSHQPTEKHLARNGGQVRLELSPTPVLIRE